MFEWALAFAIFGLGVLAATGWHRIKHEAELEDARLDEAAKFGVLLNARAQKFEADRRSDAIKAAEKHHELVREVKKIHQNLIHQTAYRRSAAHGIICRILDQHREAIK